MNECRRLPIEMKLTLRKLHSALKIVEEVLEAFSKAGENGKRLEAILVTNSGKRDEKPTRIITIWDIPEINSQLKPAKEMRS
jgi:hypothetical protein